MRADVVAGGSTTGQPGRGRPAPVETPTLTAQLDRARAALAATRATAGDAEVVAALLATSSCAIEVGELGVADAALDQAQPLLSRHALRRSPARALAAAQRALVAARRGRWEEAEAGAEQAASLALATPASTAVVQVLRAEALSEPRPGDARAEARAARHALAERAPAWAQRARRAETAAALAGGDPTGAATLVGAEDADRDTPVGHARTRALRGEVALVAGDRPAAAAALAEAAGQLAWLQARWDLVRALLALARADEGQAPRALAQARRASGEDDAFARLWATRPTLGVRLVGQAGVTVGGDPAPFATRRAEVLALYLALRGARGAPVEAACALLWPGAAAVAARPRLRTTLWEVRAALGPEAWRLRRAGDHLALELDGALVDDGAGATRWPYEEWAGALDGERARVDGRGTGRGSG